ncbi:PLD nuclease N-terminal domain-containing protein [Micromonospora sp. CPCC 206060]|uniref:PLD nuclease N-terminal domain-containing protein n=1 Tax=Micromonospora sp. CPCC 206060 TaxID=3122406 RepID=UPI002FF0A8DA
MARLSILLFVVQVILAALALISCLSAEKDEIRALPRLAWVALILLFPLLGSIAWYFAGRPVPAGPGRPGLPGGATRQPPRPVAPDDDPEFLRSLQERSAAEKERNDRELFDRWEADLRRREDDLRRRQAGDPPREEDRPEV